MRGCEEEWIRQKFKNQCQCKLGIILIGLNGWNARIQISVWRNCVYNSQ